jgi:hypothetical protein
LSDYRKVNKEKQEHAKNFNWKNQFWFQQIERCKWISSIEKWNFESLELGTNF